MIEGDHHGWYEQCLQCGYHRDLESLDKLQEQSRTDKDVTKATNG